MNNEDNNNNNNNDLLIEIDTKMIEVKQFVEQEELKKKKSDLIEEVKNLIQEANEQADAAKKLFSDSDHPTNIQSSDRLLGHILNRKRRSKKGKTRVSAAEYDQFATAVAGLSEVLRYRSYRKLCQDAGTRYESFKKNYLKKVEAKCKEVEQFRHKAKQQAEVAINAISIAAKKLFEIAQELEKEVKIEEVKLLDHKILRDEYIKGRVDKKKNSKNVKQANWVKWEGDLRVQNEIISKIENYDKNSIYAFTDGSWEPDETNRMNYASGFGVFLLTEADHPLTMCGPIDHPSGGQTSQTAELFAIEIALYAIYLLERYVGQEVVISTDNIRVVEAFNQYKKSGMAGERCNCDFNQMKKLKNEYIGIYENCQLFDLSKLQFEHVYSNRKKTKPQNPGNKEADKLVDEGRQATTTALFKPATRIKKPMHQNTDAAVEVRGVDSEGFDAVLGSEEEEPTLMDGDTDVDMD
ncbi:unnamed protein product, partial [Mesorhabditis belari]|uniref:RNase H type-1 domain-containing protein n=1 Tax=Mesorhabditis belari TaxID=2138241 RepID=A0AAF3F2Q2_9BILA